MVRLATNVPSPAPTQRTNKQAALARKPMAGPMKKPVAHIRRLVLSTS
jgi:hypothetical protein